MTSNKYQKVGRRLLTQGTLLLSATLIAACSAGGSSSGSSSSGLSIGGKINVTAGSLKLSKHKISTFSMSSHKISCETATVPPKSGEGSLNSDGTFSVSIPGAAIGEGVSCHLNDSSGNKVADAMVKDTSNKDMNGNDSMSNTLVPKTDSMDLGTVPLDADAGEITLDKASLSSVLNDAAPSSAANVFDPTGSWTITPVDFTLPKGYSELCSGGGGGHDDCNGPPSGQELYLKMFEGTRVSSGSAIFGLQLWASHDGSTSPHDAYVACGEKTGLDSTMESNLGIDFSNNSEDGAFDLVQPTDNIVIDDPDNPGNPLTVHVTDGWKIDVAKTQYNMMPCQGEMIDIDGAGTMVQGWVCGPDDSNVYQIWLGGGCVVDSTQKPVQVNDWSSLVFDSQSISGPIITSIFKGTANSVAVTCTNRYSYRSGPAGNPLSDTLSFNWTYFQTLTVASGTRCDDASVAALGALPQLQCYAGYYWQSGIGEDPNICLPRVRQNWAATDASDFAKADFRPNALVFMDEYKPFPDGSGGTMLTRQEDYRGVKLDENSYINCHTVEMGGVTIKKVNANKLMATYSASIVTTDRDVPACVANFNGAKKSWMFYLTK